MSENRQLLCTLGKMDIPTIQEQPYFKVDLLRSNILLIGSAGSGKSNFLKVLIAEIHRQLEKTAPEETETHYMNEQIYILDSSDSLKDCQNLPFISAHYDFSNEEYIKRVFYQLEKQYRDNVKLLEGLQFYSNEAAKKKIPHTTLVIDNINSFLDIKHNEKYMETLIRLARDGQTKGISIVLTGSSTKNLSSIMNYFSQKIALNLSTEEYLNIFSKKAIGNRNLVGRGYGNVTCDASTGLRTYPANLPYELQIFQMNNEVPFSYNIDEKRHSRKLTRFPLVLKESDYNNFLSPSSNVDEDEDEYNDNDVIVGVEYTKCKAVKTNYATSRVVAIYGKRNDEKPLLWKRLFSKFKENKKTNYTFIMVDDGREKLKELKAECKVEDKHYFFKRQASKRDSKHNLSIIQQFVEFIQLNLLDLKDLKRSSNSTQPILQIIMPSGYAQGLPINENNTIEHCVFILQAKDFFSNSIHANIFWGDIFPYLTIAAEELDWYFFFTDTQRIPNSDLQNHFNQHINTAILLDDIAEFVSDRGRKSVFGEMDVKELKEQFGLCEENDAYYYQVDTAELRKIKCVRKDE